MLKKSILILIAFFINLNLNCADVKGMKETSHMHEVHQADIHEQRRQLREQIHEHVGVPKEIAGIIEEYSRPHYQDVAKKIYNIVQDYMKENQGHVDQYEEEFKKFRNERYFFSKLRRLNNLSLDNKVFLMKIFLQYLKKSDTALARKELGDDAYEKLNEDERQIMSDINASYEKLKSNLKKIIENLMSDFVEFGIETPGKILFMYYQYLYSLLDERIIKAQNILTPEQVINELPYLQEDLIKLIN